MAIYSSVPPPEQQASVAAAGINIEAWTVSAMQSLSLSPTLPSGMKLSSIPLDEPAQVDSTPKHLRPKVLVRDSQKRREALLKGKEGSRRRQRWENGM
jgi:hypothetical protein